MFGNRWIPLCAVALVSLSACGGSSQDQKKDFTGIWDLRLNFTEDGCMLAAPGIQGIVDQYLIQEENSTLVVDSQGGLFSGATVPSPSGDSLLIEQEADGDFFGNGSICHQMTSASMTEPEAERSQVIFVQRLDCDDGFVCETSAVGQGKRQVGS